MLTRFVRRLGFLVFQQWMPACLIGFLMLSASPLWAQTFDPTLTVGAGIQASYQHTEPDSGTSVDQFQLNHLRLYFSGDITNYLSAMVNTEYNSSTNNMACWTRWENSTPRPCSTSGSAASSRRAIAPTCTARSTPTSCQVYTDGIQDGYPFISQGRDNGAAYWGDFKAGTVKMKLSAGAFDGASADGISQHHLGRPRPVRFLGSGERLLPERHLLRRQKPAGHRRGDRGAGLQDGHHGRLPDGEEECMNGGAFTVESEYSRYNRLGGYNGNYGKSEGGYGLVSLLFPKVIGVGKVAGTRQVRQRGVYRWNWRRHSRTRAIAKKPRKWISATS